MKSQKCFAIGFCVLFIILFIPFFSFAGSPQKSIALKDIYKTGKIEFVPVMKISKESVPTDIPFKRMSSICRVHDRLYVLDTDCSNIKVFTEDGRFIKVFGQEGSRESELNFPTRINVIDSQLVVWAARAQRFSIFNADGTFKHILQPFKKGFIEKFDSPGNGNLVIERTGIDTIGDDMYKVVSIELYSKNCQLIKVLYQKLVLYYRIVKTPGKEPVELPTPFQPDVYWSILPGNDGHNTNKVVIGCSDAYSIDIIDNETGKSRTFTHPYTPVKVNEADKNAYFNNAIIRRDEQGNYTVQKADRFMIDNTTFPEYKPVFKRFITDYEGNILVFTYTDSDNGKFPKSATEFDAFDSDGQFINHVKIANDAEIHIIRFFSDKNHIFWGQSSDTGIPLGLTKYTVK